MPYVIRPKNYRRLQTAVKTNLAQSRAWRAPNHPQACALSHTAIDDLAAKMGADSYDVFAANLAASEVVEDEVVHYNVDSQHPTAAATYLAEMARAAELMDWKAKWHPHGKGKANGSIVDGLGMALHTWGGVANNSECRLKISPDGGVESFCGSQDLGTGTRTVIAQVLAETFGLGVHDVKVNIGSSKYPASGASGGSTTVGGVSESHRRAGLDALEKIFELAAKELGAEAGNLEAVGGKISVKGTDKAITWKKACTLLGLKPLEVTASHKRGDPSTLSSSGVCGVQMAHVEVDKDTGVIKLKKFVAVQDQGLVINPTTCKSQIYGAVIMGIAAALYERRITDPKTGAFVNAELADYKLARLGDIGEIVVDLYEPESERARGVIGNGEPPAISPKAAIANAVANALGVRVPVVPLTPKRVLDALAKA
jgi:xanthine dehydrogenase YagR molybdenum-binding subunit